MLKKSVQRNKIKMIKQYTYSIYPSYIFIYIYLYIYILFVRLTFERLLLAMDLNTNLNLLHLVLICQQVNFFFIKLTDMSFHIVDWPTATDEKLNKFSAKLQVNVYMHLDRKKNPMHYWLHHQSIVLNIKENQKHFVEEKKKSNNLHATIYNIGTYSYSWQLL